MGLFTKSEGKEHSSWVEMLWIAGQFAALILLFKVYRIESRAFLQLCAMALLGFMIHSQLPLRARIHFFAGLSVTILLVIMGWVNGAWMVGLGGTLILICRYVNPWSLKLVLVSLVTVVIVVMRGLPGDWPWPAAIWPILGSMFMFRLIVLMYDLKHAKKPVSLSWMVSYFFMIPNVCFPLFPIVDFTKFKSTYYSEQAFTVYQRGVWWMFRGLTHLLAYRLVYYHWVIPASEVDSVGSLLRFMLSNYLLYLRVSGHFHIIVGLLLLFGFNLPETHHRFYLATSFTDYWRRINIYWKDFMMKLVFFPCFFAWRKGNEVRAMIGATLMVFFITWFFHLLQWYWIRGTLFLTWNEVLFWVVLAALVVWNTLREQARTREGKTGEVPGALYAVAKGLRIFGVFSTICLLWSFWTASTLAEWWLLWQITFPFGIWVVLGLIGCFRQAIREEAQGCGIEAWSNS